MKKTLGALVAARRKELGMTQLELAEKMGVTDKAVSKWERDLSCPDVASLPALAELLGLSLDELMQGKGGARAGAGGAGRVAGLALRGVALAMGVAVVVLGAVGELDAESALVMLGGGLACLAVASLREEG